MTHNTITKILIVASLVFASHITAFAQKEVSEKEMTKVYDKIHATHKYGLVITAPTAEQMTDSPSIFRKGDAWYMYYTGIFNIIGTLANTYRVLSCALLNY